MTTYVSKQYVRERVTIEAMQWHTNGGNFRLQDALAQDIVAWVKTNRGEAKCYHCTNPNHSHGENPAIAIRTASGWSYAVPGDYIVKSDGEFYRCNPTSFELRWEPATQHGATE